MSLVKSQKITNGVWELLLNRAEKLNALSGEMVTDILNELSKLAPLVASSELRVLLLTSASEKAFSAGADLLERISMPVNEVPEALDRLRLLMDGIEVFPVPTIAVLNGIAFGGGLELALACDMRVAAPSSQMGLSETRLAIIPGAGGTQRLARIVGLAKAKEWIYTAKKIGAAEALDCGLLNAIDQDPKAKALEMAAEIEKAGPIAVVSAKRAISGGWNLPLPQALDWERKCYLDLLHSEDRVEGLKAFSEKRPPSYKGK